MAWGFFLSGVAHGQVATTIDERVSGAERIVVATARTISAEWRQNSFGDQIIVSRVELEIEETLKGSDERSMVLEVEGGTIDGLTLRVSSLPLLRTGDRAVFFTRRGERTANIPHPRGQGILFLDDQNVVRGSSLRLADIRSRARVAGR